MQGARAGRADVCPCLPVMGKCFWEVCTFPRFLKEAVTQRSCRLLLLPARLRRVHGTNPSHKPIISILQMWQPSHRSSHFPTHWNPQVCLCLASLSHQIRSEVLAVHTSNYFPSSGLEVSVPGKLTGTVPEAAFLLGWPSASSFCPKWASLTPV